ncbi:MAG: ThuA domain-containing protein, partial [Saprospiraceae bacterium]|nr:ThuA domain-containing protein [Saprospiraceae bacterium]
TTAQRLIVENYEGNSSFADKLVSQSMKSINNPFAIHLLWSLDGITEVPEELIDLALDSKASAVRKAAIALLPNSLQGSEKLVTADLLNDPDLFVRRDAALRASELPETTELYAAMQRFAEDNGNTDDKWLDAAARIYFREKNMEDIDERDVHMVISSHAEAPAEWKYATTEPDGSWMSPDYDDATWESGRSIFGTPDIFPEIGSTWETDEIWLRRSVDLPEEISGPVIKALVDDDMELYINGRLVWTKKGHTRNAYVYSRLGADITLPAGKTTIAVKALNNSGNQYIDVGIGKVAEFQADRTVVLNTVSSKMIYDQTRVHATAGEKISIVLNNVDEMQHNLVLVEPGSTEAFGKIVDQFTRDPRAAEMQYVPESRYVIGATDMLDPGESALLNVQLPDQAGDYPYICTFPAHWQMMQGVLEVSPKGTYISNNANAPRIVTMGGGSSHEFLRDFGIADGRLMHQGGNNTVHYTENSTDLVRLLPEADVLLISNNQAFSAEAQEAIFQHVDAGKSMMIYHPSAWYNWEDWPAYNRNLVGGGSRSHEPLQEFEVIVKRSQHPIMKGVPNRFRIIDELYRWERDSQGPRVEVLAVGRGLESGDEYPVVFVVHYKKAKVLVNTLGHDTRAHGLAAYQQILENAVDWSLGSHGKPAL